jgi:uroporphyrinogen decarboxylase
MNGLERIVEAVQFHDAGPAPVVPQVFGHAAAVAGVSLDDYVRDGETLAHCQLKALKQYGYDAVFSVMDVNVEAEALGSVLQYPKNRYPVIGQFVLSPGSDWSGLQVPDCRKAGRMPEMLTALGLLRRELGNQVLIAGCVMGPFTLATQLLGLENTLYLAIDDPLRLECLMDFAAEVVIRFGEAQIEAGAHLALVFDPAASPAVVPRQFFREFELPRLQRVFQAFAQSGAVANWLHIAGPAAPILPFYPAAGVHIANFDYSVSAAAAREQLRTTCLNGNIKSMLFVEGKPAEVRAEAIGLLHAFRDRGGFILSSGCEIPPESVPGNVAAMVDAARSIG